MKAEYFRVRFLMTLAVIMDPLARGTDTMKEWIAYYVRQGWEVLSEVDSVHGTGEYVRTVTLRRTT